jgi:Rad3-related DNA helicase
MMQEVTGSLEDREDLLISAPTGTGKTAGALYPAIVYALEHNKKIFYLTARTTRLT